MSTPPRRSTRPARAAALAGLTVLLVLVGPAAVGLAALVAQDQAALSALTRDRARAVASVAGDAAASGRVDVLVEQVREPGLVEVVVVLAGGDDVSSAPGLAEGVAPAPVLRALDRGGEAVARTTLDEGTREAADLAGRRVVVAGVAGTGTDAVVIASTAPVEARAAQTRTYVAAVLLLLALLAALARGLRAREELRQERAARARERDLTADLAHELRAPVSTLATAASLVTPVVDDVPVGGREPVLLMLAEVDRLQRLVEDMLQLSRLEHGDGDVELEAVNLPRLVHSVLAARGGEDPVVLEPADDVFVAADRRVVARIAVNLVENAIRHGGGAAVRVVVHATDDRGVLEVEDEGPGVPPERRERVFDRFAGSGGGSSGLGLALVRAGAEAMGGTARMDEGTAGGARVVVALLLAPAPVSHHDQVGSTSSVGEQGRAPSTR